MRYGATRNYAAGAVTYLGPYISRGVISTRDVFEYTMTLGIPWPKVEKFIQELAWRDYWQQVWVAKGQDIDTDLKRKQEPVSNYQIPKAINDANTGIRVLNEAIRQLYKTGYMHNHMRMYVASICCNIAKSHWLEPSKWMYAYLLDGDIASNQLSWQWVAGSFSNKKYFANQDNINKFFSSTQKNTFLDVDYESFPKLETPEILSKVIPFDLKTTLADLLNPTLQENKTTLIYNYYNLDPLWHKGEDVQRILLFEPSKFEKNPISERCLNFALELSENIPNIIVFKGEFEELLSFLSPEKIIYKAHPLNANYQGTEEPREWLSSIEGYFPSFFSFWKKCKKELE